MKSFNEATSQVAGLMAAIGGSLDAYEEDHTSSAPPVPETNNAFEAAYASVQSHLQHNEVVNGVHPVMGRIHPQDINEATYEATGKTPAELVRDMAALSDELGGLTMDNPLDQQTVIEEVGEDYPTPADELAFFAEQGITHPKDADPEPEDSPDFDGKFWDCMTGHVLNDQAPKPVEEKYKMLGSVVAYGELKDIYDAFKWAQETGEPQTVTIESGTYEMTPSFNSSDMVLHDTGKGRRYVQQTHHACVEGYDQIEEGDLFVWVIDDTADEDDLGYIHNRWVFVLEQGQ